MSGLPTNIQYVCLQKVLLQNLLSLSPFFSHTHTGLSQGSGFRVTLLMTDSGFGNFMHRGKITKLRILEFLKDIYP